MNESQTQVKQIQTNRYRPKHKGEEAAPSAPESVETPKTTVRCEPVAQPCTRKQRGFPGLKPPSHGRDYSADIPGRQAGRTLSYTFLKLLLLFSPVIWDSPFSPFTNDLKFLFPPSEALAWDFPLLLWRTVTCPSAHQIILLLLQQPL